MQLTVLYRGLLTSCNYACQYCPFAKRQESLVQQERDQQSLRNFTAWITSQPDIEWRVLVTPWGEALVRRWYRKAVVELSRLPHVTQVAVQTNFSCGTAWLSQSETSKVCLWAAYHPTQTSPTEFARRVLQAQALGVQVRPGSVGIPDHLAMIDEVRSRIGEAHSFWINAWQPRPRAYTVEEVQRFTQIDPEFTLTLKRQPSLGRMCPTGDSLITVDGHGLIRRCHFVAGVITEIRSPEWRTALQPRPCPRRFCNCYLGLAQLSQLENPAMESPGIYSRMG